MPESLHAIRDAIQAKRDSNDLSARISQLEADNAALMEVVRHAIAMRSVVHDTDLCGLELEIAEQKHKDALDAAIEALPDNVRDLAGQGG